jgi:hypothetical protein
VQDLTLAADLFAPVHERTAGNDGFVSLEVSPLLAYDAAGSVTAATALHKKANRPNLYIKIPGTKEGNLAKLQVAQAQTRRYVLIRLSRLPMSIRCVAIVWATSSQGALPGRVRFASKVSRSARISACVPTS